METKREYIAVKTKVENNFRDMVTKAISQAKVKYVDEDKVPEKLIESLMNLSNIQVELIHLNEEVRDEILRKGEDEFGKRLNEIKWLSENARALLKFKINIAGVKKEVNFFLENKNYVGGKSEMKIEMVYSNYFLLNEDGQVDKPTKKMEQIVRIFEDIAREINYNIIDATTEMRLISKWKAEDAELQKMLILDEYSIVIRNAGIKNVEFKKNDIYLTMANGLVIGITIDEFKKGLKKFGK